jgi:hypothetical protein
MQSRSVELGSGVIECDATGALRGRGPRNRGTNRSRNVMPWLGWWAVTYQTANYIAVMTYTGKTPHHYRSGRRRVYVRIYIL